MHTNRLIKSTLSTFLFSFIYIFRPSPLFDLTLKKNHITKWEKVFEKKTVHPKKKKTRMHPRYRISNIPRYKIRNLNTFVKRKEGRVSVSLRNRIRKKKKERRRTLIQSSIETYRSNSSREVETKSKSLGLCIDGKCNEREKSSLSFFFFFLTAKIVTF